MLRRLVSGSGSRYAVVCALFSFSAFVACDSSGLKDRTTNDPLKPGDKPVTPVLPEEEETFIPACQYSPEGLPDGRPCVTDSQCGSGACGYQIITVSKTDPDGEINQVEVVKTFCTKSCANIGSGCGPGTACTDDAKGQRVCAPTELPKFGGVEYLGPCNGDLDCCAPGSTDEDCKKSGNRCYNITGYGVGYCTKTCTADSQCPNNCTHCWDAGSAGFGDEKMCLNKGGRAIGQTCQGVDPFECADGFCYSGKCTALCRTCAPDLLDESSTTPCTPSPCPESGQCGRLETASGTFEICYDPSEFGSKDPGESCTADHQCKDEEKCIQVSTGDQTRGMCSAECQGQSDCPDNAECVPYNGKNQCVPFDDLAKKPDGEKCSGNLECDSLNCADLGDEQICARSCNVEADCGEGYGCVGYASWAEAPLMSAFVIDTFAQEYTIGDDSLFGGGGRRAQLRVTGELIGGREHWLEIGDELLLAMFGIIQEGLYTISVDSDLAPSGLGRAVSFETNSDNAETPSQTLAAPGFFSGGLRYPAPDTGDYDRYVIGAYSRQPISPAKSCGPATPCGANERCVLNTQFGTTPLCYVARENVDIQVRGPQLKACYKKTSSNRGLGAQCSGDYNCGNNLSCHLDLFACTKHCVSDMECGGGASAMKCRPVAGVRQCVNSADVDVTPVGSPCVSQFGYSCQGVNECLSVQNALPFCTDACATNNDCPGSMQCVNLGDSESAKMRCVHASALNYPAGAACSGDFQCASGACSTDPEDDRKQICE